VTGDVNLRDSLVAVVFDAHVSPELARQTTYGKLQGLASAFSSKSGGAEEFVAVPLINVEGSLMRPNVRVQMRSRTTAAAAVSVTAKEIAQSSAVAATSDLARD